MGGRFGNHKIFREPIRRVQKKHFSSFSSSTNVMPTSATFILTLLGVLFAGLTALTGIYTCLLKRKWIYSTLKNKEDLEKQATDRTQNSSAINGKATTVLMVVSFVSV
ncbi:hypothetical protein BS50DRAFT_222100 [Corynespora cassiicola Philippines]|uniref:Uncharacterized protein n=1 Tax=Corynespora cassiicola Philippines TaxID=1448308 RepID=A0A2T2N377_CORCC|nr:hypothetical protein BS50DRAFT_222100 [Corynespora cassiicola Philippines]